MHSSWTNAALALAAFISIFPASAAEKAETFRASYPGVIAIEVDATDIDHRIFRVRQAIPVKPGPLTLLYPEWVPGNHGPSPRSWLLTGLKLSAGGRDVAWQRDPSNVAAFMIDVPKGATELQVEFQHLSPLRDSQGQLRVMPELLAIEWQNAMLYPAGVHSDGIRMHPTVKLPSGWELATSLDVEGRSGDLVKFATVSLTDLMDSPVWAGHNVRRIELDPGSSIPVTMDVFADRSENLAAETDHIAAFRSMIQQTYKVFGAPNYKRYEVLVALHDHFSPIGLEHLSSTEIRRAPGLFTKWKTTASQRGVFAHEFVHSWVGKKHRPADLAVPNFNVPVKDALLWSYEGETSYWGNVIAARSGLHSKEQALAALARSGAFVSGNVGRAWRSLQDTTNEPIMRHTRQRDWSSWQRGADYYGESVFLWLEVDTRIRGLTGGKSSMDDFARAFHGGKANAPGVVTYNFDDIVKALNDIAPNDWRAFLRERLDSTNRDPATEALKAVGWRIVFKEKPTEYAEAADKEDEVTDFIWSLGFNVGKSDAITNVQWEGPAFKAGIAGASTLVAVNGRAYKADILKAAITSAKQTGVSIALLVKSHDLYRTVEIPYKGGLRYPHLERIPDTPDLLSPVLEARQ